MAQPKLSHFFDETITKSQFTEEWFDKHVCFFLTIIEHFLILYIDLQTSFYINNEEEKNHTNIALSEVISKHQKEILSYVNQAARDGKDIEEATNIIIKEVLDRHT